MANSVIVGRLHRVEGDEIVVGGGLRVRLSPGVNLLNVPLETSLTIVAVYRDGAICADSVARPRQLSGHSRRNPDRGQSFPRSLSFAVGSS